ncbi:MAG: YncE family protein [Candidatus Baltobacteraceae bacterium]
MPLIAAAPPERVPLIGGFDYVIVDPARRRVYAAHRGNQSLMIVDADTGKLVGQVRVGPLAGVALNLRTGHVYTGNGNARSVSEIDPVTLKEVRSFGLPGPVDAIAYDPASGSIYADENDGTHIWIVDSKTFKQIGSIELPGHKPEYLAINAGKRELYQNIADISQVVIIDLRTNKVVRTLPTPLITDNHPLQYDPAFDHILVGGANGMLGVYDSTGKLLSQLSMVQSHVDQCSLDQERHLLACAGTSKITLIKDNQNSPPRIVGTIDVAQGLHTVAIDPKTGDIWGVWADDRGDWVQRFRLTP